MKMANAAPIKTQAEIDFEKDTAFQADVLPIIEKAISAEYPREYVADEEGNINIDVDMDAFNEDASYYFDSTNHDKNIVIFVVDNENDKIKRIKKILKDELGEDVKVKFKKAKHNVKEFTKKQNQIAALLASWNIPSQVNYNQVTEIIDITAGVNEDQIKELQDQFGASNLNITVEDVPMLSPHLAQDFAYNNLGGGIRIYDSLGYASTSGFIAVKNNQAYMVTAGHVTVPRSGETTPYFMRQGNSGSSSQIGEKHWSGYNPTNHYDLGVIRLTNTSQYVNSRFYTKNNGGAIDGQLKPTVLSSDIAIGININKSGATSGITGGKVTAVNTPIYYDTDKDGSITDESAFYTIGVTATVGLGYSDTVHTTKDLMSGEGDSGGTVYRASDYALVGVISGGASVYTDSDGIKYSKTSYVEQAWEMQTYLGAITPYMYTYDTKLSELQG